MGSGCDIFWMSPPGRIVSVVYWACLIIGILALIAFIALLIVCKKNPNDNADQKPNYSINWAQVFTNPKQFFTDIGCLTGKYITGFASLGIVVTIIIWGLDFLICQKSKKSKKSRKSRKSRKSKKRHRRSKSDPYYDDYYYPIPAAEELAQESKKTQEIQEAPEPQEAQEDQGSDESSEPSELQRNN